MTNLISVEHQIHFGRKFYQDKKTGYWISTDYPRTRAHRWVWSTVHGEIPVGYEIHHKNHNRSDNGIENLELMEKKDHVSFHGQSEERKIFFRAHAERIRPLTKEWHRSAEGREWHKAHVLVSLALIKPIKIICKVCSKEAETKNYHQEFCSNICKSKWRRDQRLDDIDKVCPVCEKSYRSSKYARSNTCGKECGQKLRWMKNKEELNLLVCA